MKNPFAKKEEAELDVIEPNEPVQKVLARQSATRMMNVKKNETCKNGNFFLVTKVLDKKINKVGFFIRNDGCRNARRVGSAWCQGCSDAKNKYEN